MLKDYIAQFNLKLIKHADDLSFPVSTEQASYRFHRPGEINAAKLFFADVVSYDNSNRSSKNLLIKFIYSIVLQECL